MFFVSLLVPDRHSKLISALIIFTPTTSTHSLSSFVLHVQYVISHQHGFCIKDQILFLMIWVMEYYIFALFIKSESSEDNYSLVSYFKSNPAVNCRGIFEKMNCNNRLPKHWEN